MIASGLAAQNIRIISSWAAVVSPDPLISAKAASEFCQIDTSKDCLGEAGLSISIPLKLHMPFSCSFLAFFLICEIRMNYHLVTTKKTKPLSVEEQPVKGACVGTLGAVYVCE